MIPGSWFRSQRGRGIVEFLHRNFQKPLKIFDISYMQASCHLLIFSCKDSCPDKLLGHTEGSTSEVHIYMNRCFKIFLRTAMISMKSNYKVIQKQSSINNILKLFNFITIFFPIKIIIYFFKDGKHNNFNWKVPTELWNAQKVSDQKFWFLKKASKKELAKKEKLDESKRGEQVSIYILVFFSMKK